MFGDICVSSTCLRMFSLILSALFFNQVSGFGKGGPISSCIDGYPKHRLPVQTTPPPYTIRVNTSTYRPNEVLEVTLTSPVQWTFRGFHLRAHRTSGDTEEVLGDFIETPPNVLKQFWYPVEKDQFNCITHNDDADKNNVTVQWRAPNKTSGDIVFTTTFVRNFEEYWIQVESAVIQDENHPPVPSRFAGKVEQDFKPTNYTKECGVSRGCFLYPLSCSGDDCEYVASYHANVSAGYVEFEIMGSNSGYIALAFSDDVLMTDDHSIACISQGSKVVIRNGYNRGRTYAHHRIVGLTELYGKKSEDKLFCRFRRPMVMTILNTSLNRDDEGKYPVYPVTFDLSLKWFLFLAFGPVFEGTHIAGIHKVLPLVSTEKIDVTSVAVHFGQSVHRDLKIHGILMVFAWVLFAGMATILARYQKDAMSRLCCDSAVWFQLHRTCAVLVAACTAAGIIVMFTYLKQWTQRGVLHAVFGLVVAGILFIQIIAGICRPAKDSSNRTCFNWLHKISGKCVHILSAVTMFLAFQVPLIPPHLMTIETTILAIWVLAQVMWELLFEFFFRRYEGNMKSLKAGKSEISGKGQGHRAVLLAYALYGLTMAALLSASVYFIVVS